MFKEVKNINDILPFVDDKKEIRFLKQPNGVTIGCYMFADKNTFNNIESLECRGIAFDEDGNIVSRPLHKFFNLGENESVSEDKVKSKQIAKVFDKIDGSMIATCFLNGQLLLRSKKSFTSDVVYLAWEFLNQEENKNILDFATEVAKNNMTAIFELTHPKARIVVEPKAPDLTLLHVRDNFSGEYVLLNDNHEIHDLIKKYNIKEVKTFDTDLICAVESLEDLKNREGYVIQFDNGDMIKIKCPWYLRLHNSITFLRERDIALAAIHEDLDDIKSALKELNIDISKVEEVETRLKNNLIEIQAEIESIYEKDKNLERKDFAIKHKSNQYFGLLMNQYVGKEVDIPEWYKKHRLKNDFGLGILAENISSEEAGFTEIQQEETNVKKEKKSKP